MIGNFAFVILVFAAQNLANSAEDPCSGKSGAIRYTMPESGQDLALFCDEAGATLVGCYDDMGFLRQKGNAFANYKSGNVLGFMYECTGNSSSGFKLPIVACAAPRQPSMSQRVAFGEAYRPFIYKPELVYHCRAAEGSDESASFHLLPEACVSGTDLTACNCVSGDAVCGVDGPWAETLCVPPHRQCDGKTHCWNGADEQNCTSCNEENAFFCGSDVGFPCIKKFLRCDGKNDCPNGRDEENCECPAETFDCFPNSTRQECVPKAQRCNGIKNCRNDEDEIDCPTCVGDAFVCGDGATVYGGCVPADYRCDGFDDCGNGADEEDCETAPPNGDE